MFVHLMEHKEIRCMLLMTALDLPARSLVFNMQQFNGKFGCLWP